MNEPQPSQEEIVQAIYAFAAQQLKNGAADSEVQSMLV